MSMLYFISDLYIDLRIFTRVETAIRTIGKCSNNSGVGSSVEEFTKHLLLLHIG